MTDKLGSTVRLLRDKFNDLKYRARTWAPTQSYRNPYRKGRFLMNFPRFFVDFLAGGEAALAADWIAAWNTVPGRLR